MKERVGLITAVDGMIRFDGTCVRCGKRSPWEDTERFYRGPDGMLCSGCAAPKEPKGE